MKKAKIIIFLILLAVFVLISCETIRDRRHDPQRLFTIEQLQQDFFKLRKILENNNPTLYNFHSREALDRYFDTVSASIDTPMLAKDFFILLSRVVTKANCGHTYLELPDGYWKSANKIYKYFPFKLYFQDGRAYVLRNYSKDLTIPLGAEVVSINQISMFQIIQDFLAIISSDGLNLSYKYAKMNRIDYGLFPGYPDFPDSYQITYRTLNDSINKLAAIEALSRDEIIASRKQLFPDDWHYVPYNSRIIDSLSTAILTVKDFVSYSKKEFLQFLASGFESIHQKEIQNLIIDVRNNDGGDPQHANAILTYLADSPYIYFSSHVLGYWSLKKPVEPHPLHFSGNTFVLIDGGCFSTTGHFLSLIKFHKWGTLIGEESGGSYVCNGCVENYTLPHTRIVLNCSRCVYRTNVHGFSRERGIMPDIEVKPRIEDLIEKRDTVMEFVLEIVRRQT